MIEVCKRCHYTMVEAVASFELHATSILYTCNVFEHLLLWWMGIWMHTHTIAIIIILFPDLRKLVETLGDGSLQTLPLHYGWGCSKFQTSSSFILIYKVFEHILLRWMAIWINTHKVIIITNCFPLFWELVETLGDVSVPTMPLHYGWGCSKFQTASCFILLHI